MTESSYDRVYKRLLQTDILKSIIQEIYEASENPILREVKFRPQDLNEKTKVHGVPKPTYYFSIGKHHYMFSPYDTTSKPRIDVCSLIESYINGDLIKKIFNDKLVPTFNCKVKVIAGLEGHKTARSFASWFTGQLDYDDKYRTRFNDELFTLRGVLDRRLENLISEFEKTNEFKEKQTEISNNSAIERLHAILRENPNLRGEVLKKGLNEFLVVDIIDM